MKLTFLVGSLAKDVEVAKTKSDKDYVRFSFSVSNDYQNKDKEWIKQDPTWYNAVAYNNIDVFKNLKTKTRYFFVGELTVSEYQDKEGITKKSVNFTPQMVFEADKAITGKVYDLLKELRALQAEVKDTYVPSEQAESDDLPF